MTEKEKKFINELIDNISNFARETRDMSIFPRIASSLFYSFIDAAEDNRDFILLYFTAKQITKLFERINQIDFPSPFDKSEEKKAAIKLDGEENAA